MIIKSKEEKFTNIDLFTKQYMIDCKQDDVFLKKLIINGRYPSDSFIQNNNSSIALYVISGKGIYYENDTLTNIQKGDIVVISNNIKYCIEGKKLNCLFICGSKI